MDSSGSARGCDGHLLVVTSNLKGTVGWMVKMMLMHLASLLLQNEPLGHGGHGDGAQRLALQKLLSHSASPPQICPTGLKHRCWAVMHRYGDRQSLWLVHLPSSREQTPWLHHFEWH